MQMTSLIPNPASESEIRTASRPNCILCSSEGELLYSGQQDRLFGTYGEWSNRLCSNPSCGLLWQDPMPLPEDIGKAYANYYTHAENTPEGNPSFGKRMYRQAKRNWLSARYGYPEDKAGSSGYLFRIAHYMLPMVCLSAFRDVRFLRYVPGGSVLDVGCGDGSWLASLKNLGWKVEGTDFDPEAVRVASQRGLNVHVGGLEDQGYPPNSFDAITLSHVIEHVPDPEGTIRECVRLLKPGGRLVLFTPNASSLCHQFFRQDWRGLEPPRHLHVFSFNSMRTLLDRVGFQEVSIRPDIGTSVTYESYLLWRNAPRPLPAVRQNWRSIPSWRLFAGLQSLLVGLVPSIGECLAAVAVKR
jgi:2-polyprenyl-3-methyl-5-hydroxy-6-metoxy-1,4-benzoquinol methylase